MQQRTRTLLTGIMTWIASGTAGLLAYFEGLPSPSQFSFLDLSGPALAWATSGLSALTLWIRTHAPGDLPKTETLPTAPEIHPPAPSRPAPTFESAPVPAYALERAELEDMLLIEESRVERVYPDPLHGMSKPTAGIGHLLTPLDEPFYSAPENTPVPAAVVDAWFEDDVTTALAGARRVYGAGWDKLPKRIRMVLAAMAFQMGAQSLSGFRNTLRYMRLGAWQLAAQEMLDSEWHNNDTPSRARRMSAIVDEVAGTQLAVLG